jgi:hypothetical protein
MLFMKSEFSDCFPLINYYGTSNTNCVVGWRKALAQQFMGPGESCKNAFQFHQNFFTDCFSGGCVVVYEPNKSVIHGHTYFSRKAKPGENSGKHHYFLKESRDIIAFRYGMRDTQHTFWVINVIN